MSTSITIPNRSGKQRASASTPGGSSLRDGTSVESDISPASASPGGVFQSDGKDKGKLPARDSASWGRSSPWGNQRRVSLLSSSISKSEHTVVNIGDPDGPPRLITCVKASQGFDWNQDIFLPSYISDHDYSADLERRQDPVEDIFISDEEAEGMFPR